VPQLSEIEWNSILLIYLVSTFASFAELFLFQITSPRSKRKSRGSARGNLRRHHEIDHVVVQEPFTLNEPLEVASTSDRRVGDGCYVSATVNNRRYYGVLVDQEALKSASMLYFQDEASGLDLNRRMKALKQKAETSAEVQEDDSLALEQKAGTSEVQDDDSLDRKRPALQDFPAPRPKKIKTEDFGSLPVLEQGIIRQVQKFRYVDPDLASANGSTQGYRLLLATFADVEAAAEDDVEKASRIEAACRSGGGFVVGRQRRLEES
jgi:hypothetical protein